MFALRNRLAGIQLASIAKPLRSVHMSASLLNRRVLFSDPIDPRAGDVFKAAGYETVFREKVPVAELKEMIKDFDALVVRSGTQVTSEIINASSRLKVIGRAGTGVDNIDIDAATTKGKLVMNTPGGNTASAAELTVSLLMALARQIPVANQSLRDGRWERKKFMGVELAGKTIGVVGLGQIGRRVAAACQGLGMKTVGYDPILNPKVAQSYNVDLMSLEELYPRCDFITLHTPLTNDTRDLFNDETFSKCKKGMRIINCARGGIINEAALLRALASGQCAGAALDVFETEPPPESSKFLIEHPNVICTPHLGASTQEAQGKVALEISQQILDYFKGGRLQGVVNSKLLQALYEKQHLNAYIDAAERLGNLQSQLLVGNLTKVQLRTRGSLVKNNGGVLVAAALKGILSNMVSESVNYINAPQLAEEFGLQVEEIHDTAASAYGSSVALTFFTDEGGQKMEKKLVASVLGDHARIVQYNQYSLDLEPQGTMMFFQNDDRPGLLAQLCTVVGKHNLNISSFSLGRNSQQQTAVGALGLDSPLNTLALGQIREIDGMRNVQVASLPRLDDPLEGFDSDAEHPQPSRKPNNPNFGSGPTTKYKGYAHADMNTRTFGRSHRSNVGKAALADVIEQQKKLLGIPADYELGIVPASDTGAFEMAMWSMLGERPVDVCYWDAFGKGWNSDIENELKLENTRVFSADYGEIPDLSQTDSDNDIVFTYNGTTSGVKVPHLDWISEERKGLTFCDATSAVFSMDMEWEKLDVTTWSWQKALGGEGAHGMIALSPRAIERLESYNPPRPIPKVFRMTKKGQLDRKLFQGATINTPSMMAVEDCLMALAWVQDNGGQRSMVQKSLNNLRVLENFVKASEGFDFLVQDPSIRSNTSVTLTCNLEPAQLKRMLNILADQNVAFDIGSYRDAPNGLRIWCGPTIEASDLDILTGWMSWAYHHVVNHENN